MNNFASNFRLQHQELAPNVVTLDDGNGGQLMIPAAVRQLPPTRRAQCELALGRYLTEQAVRFIPSNSSPWAKQEIERAPSA